MKGSSMLFVGILSGWVRSEVSGGGGGREFLSLTAVSH